MLCGEAYMSGLKAVGRQVMPVYSLITLDRTTDREPVVRNRLANPAHGRIVQIHHRLPLQNCRRANPLRREGGAVSFRLEDR